MNYYVIKFNDIQGEKTIYMKQWDLAIFMLKFNRDIEIVSVQKTRRRFQDGGAK